MFLSMLNGSKIDFSASEKTESYVLAASGNYVNLVDKYDLGTGNYPPDSIAILPIQHEIMSRKSMELVRLIQIAESDPNIIAVVFLVNSPGGMVFYTDITAGVIASMTKPSVAFVMNMAASAAMWLISSTKRIILSSPLDRVGSIGVMASIMDFSRMLKEKLKIDIFEIYADKSTNKNLEIRNLLNEELTDEERRSLIKDDLNYVNEFFHQAISKNLGISLDSEVFTGKIYNAQRAIELGLAHEINTFEYAVNHAMQMGRIIQFNKLNP